MGLLVGRPGKKECAGCERVGVAELCVWVPRCGENLHVFLGFAQTRTTRPTPLEGPRVSPQILDTWLHPEPGIPDPEARELLSSLGSAFSGFCLYRVTNCATSPRLSSSNLVPSFTLQGQNQVPGQPQVWLFCPVQCLNEGVSCASRLLGGELQNPNLCQG